MALERCDVETWAEFGFIGMPSSPKLVFGARADVFLCTGCDEIYVFSTKERKITVVLQVPGPVSDLVLSQDKEHLYVACTCGVYCVHLQLLLSSGPRAADASSRPTELKISSKFLIVPEKGVSSLLLVGSELVTISQKGSRWMLTLYRSQKQRGTRSCQMLTSFSQPLASDSNEGRTVTRRPALICVHNGSKRPSSVCGPPPETASHGHFPIDPVLFQLLFGIDAALAESPVVLCGLPDGGLYFLPLRLPGARPRALCSLEQPVVFVGASSVDESGPEHAPCLVAMGEQGRVVLIRTRKGPLEDEANAACFLDRCLPGRLMCGCVVKNTLCYSVGSDFLKLDLSSGSYGKEGRDGKEEAPRRTEALHQSPTSLNVCKIIAVAQLGGSTAGGDIQLLGLSVGGQLRRITMHTRPEDADLSSGPTVQVGRSVRDHLSAIGDVCERASVLKSALRSQGQVLKQLNHLVHISLLLTARAQTEEQARRRREPIRCGAVTQWSRLLQKDSLNLMCVLDNSSPYTLEQGWTLCICVSPLSHPPSQGGKCSSANFSFPLQNINPGESFQAWLPLAAAGEAFLPSVLSCSLIFSLSRLLRAQEADSPRLQDACISLPLNTLRVDWLHSLQLSGPEAARKKDAAQLSSTSTERIQAFLKSRRFSCGGAEEGRWGAPTLEQHSASVQVSVELLKSTTGWKSSSSEGQGQNMCVSFLEWLLCEGCGGVRRGQAAGGISSPAVLARGPGGHAVRLTAKEVNVGEECTGREGSLTTVLLQIQSSSLAAVCGLHHAVLCRLQTLLQTAPPKAAHGLPLRRTMLRLENLLQQIQHSGVSGAFGVGVSRTPMTPSLRSIYRDLRENPLILL